VLDAELSGVQQINPTEATRRRAGSKLLEYRNLQTVDAKNGEEFVPKCLTFGLFTPGACEPRREANSSCAYCASGLVYSGPR
jgi:hypothetical protein